MMVGNALIYVPGLLWLGYLVAAACSMRRIMPPVWAQTIAWGLSRTWSATR